MKSILSVIFALAFSFNLLAQSNDLPEIKNLKQLNGKEQQSNIQDKKTPKPRDFGFTVNPYLWASAIGGTIGVPNTPSGYPMTYEFNKSFSDAVKNIKMAFMIGGKLRYKQWNLYYDFMYLNLKEFGVKVPEGHGISSANTTNKEFITDLSLAYRIPSKSTTVFVNAYAGTRIWSLKSDMTFIDLQGASKMVSSSSSWVDPIIGIHANFLLGKKWFSYIRTDFGGFNVNSAYTFMIMGGFGYDFSPNWNTTLGLKDLSVDYNKKGTRWNVNQYGILISLGYRY